MIGIATVLAALGGGLLYAGTLTILAAVSVYGRTPSRRRNARATLALLVRSQGRSGSDDEPS
ncbi:hypothetical protein [Nonomuraea sp. NPDC049695]|uniref:hypothetical protein n=1 Tax=Nonomuraea sp. NPDC049695 TaxID=3154734 RepID=UPI00341F8293